jgi:tetratricopeptide (TPR) repeat protein
MIVNDYLLYRNALELYKKNKIEEFTDFIKNPLLSNTEKKLLQSRMELREKNWDVAIAMLNKTFSNNHGFLTAEAGGLIAYAYSMKGEWQQAIIANDKAIMCYKDFHFSNQLFNSYYNQSVYYSRLGLLELANYYLQFAEVHAFDLSEKLSINRAQAANYSKLMEYEKAILILEKDITDLLKSKMTESSASYLLVASDIYCRARQYPKAFAILDNLILIKKVPFRARVLFEYSVLKALMEKKYSPLNWSETILSDEHYGIKAKIINLLLVGRIQEAKDFWIELAQKEPNNYFPEFSVKFESDKNSLYFVFIQKIRNLKNKDQISTSQLSGKIKLLYQLLQENSFPMSKEELIEKIWSIQYDPNFDSRFYKLIQRLKSTINCTIENNHGGYFIK